MLVCLLLCQLAHHEGESKRISAVALVESCRLRDKEDSQDIIEFLAQHVVNWKRSQVSV